MSDYRLLSYASETGRPRAGLLVGDRIIDLVDALPGESGFDSVLSVLGDWPRAEDAIGALLAGSEAASSGQGRPLSAVRLTAPILHPGALFCAGANYRDHSREMRGDKPPGPGSKEPFFFLKTSAHSIVGPEAEIRLPEFSSQIDWEAEIGVVIGLPARNVPVERALDYVAGYLIVNDLSARDHLRREDTPFGFDWLGQKCFDTSCPMGPWITPASRVPDPQDLDIRLWVNDELMQDSNSAEMIFGVAEQIAYLSRHVTLRPGDVIATGTPAGVGRPRGIFLEPGDRVRIVVEGLGELCNPVVGS